MLYLEAHLVKTDLEPGPRCLTLNLGTFLPWGGREEFSADHLPTIIAIYWCFKGDVLNKVLSSEPDLELKFLGKVLKRRK